MKILAIDPSTDVTGAALVRFDGKEPVPLRVAVFTSEAPVPKGADSLTKRLLRIRSIRHQLSDWVGCLPYGFDAVAYEVPNMRGAAATSAINQAIGAYLTLSLFAHLPILPVHSSSVKAVCGMARFRPNVERAERAERVREEKRQMIAWANETFGMALGEGDDARADALAVAVAAYKLSLKPPRAKKPRAKKATAS